MKLYCIKMSRQVWHFSDGKFATKAGYNTALSIKQASELIDKNGINRVEFIRHDDKTPKNTRLLNRDEMLEFWKAVTKK